MAAWPDVEEVIRLLDIGDQEWIEEHLENALEAAIEYVKTDVGDWDEYVDIPTTKMRQAALRAVAVMRVNAPDDGWRALASDRIYRSLMFGHKRRFGVA